MSLSRRNSFIFPILGGLLLSLAYTQLGIGWVLLIAIVPFLIVEEYIFENREQYRTIALFIRIFPGFLLLNIISISWIWYATAAGSIFAVIWNTTLMCLVFLLYHKVRLNLGRKEASIALVVFWICFEFIYLRVTLSFPWLLLGNGFANNVTWIQWYDITGVLGGTLWVLVINLLIFEIVRLLMIDKKITSQIWKYIIGFGIVFLVPLTYSYIKYYTWEEKGDKYDVVVLQPNIDPYHTKFHGSVLDQQYIMMNLADSLMDENVDYVVFPETALPYYLDDDSLLFENHLGIKTMHEFNSKYPKTKFIIGLTSRHFYYDDSNLSSTAHAYDDFWFDEYNSTCQIDTAHTHQLYFKSKLVPGVETLPLVDKWKWLNDLIINLGGIRNSLGFQEERTAFYSPQDSCAVGTPICYESIYGEFVSKFVRNGANFLFIMTNDGWWRDTPGYKQHAMFARIRAIENRRSVARSANTGISMIINQRGDVLDSRGWWVKDALRGDIQANKELSFYTKYGDFLGRISLVISLLILLHLLVYRVKRRK